MATIARSTSNDSTVVQNLRRTVNVYALVCTRIRRKLSFLLVLMIYQWKKKQYNLLNTFKIKQIGHISILDGLICNKNHLIVLC